MSEASSSDTGETYDIHIDGLHRRFGRVRALRGMDLRVRHGAIYGLIGNNGAGKTTAIHCMLGLIPPDQGSIRVLGLDPVRKRVDVLKDVGFFPERDAPYEWMKLRTLFRVGEAAYAGWDRELCMDLCGRFNLFPGKRIKQLSKGMVAKAKLIYALAHRPRCLVFDEPTSGLDPSARYELLEMIRAMADEHHVTTLLSSHNLGDIEGVATDVGVLHEGKLIFSSAMDRANRGFQLIEVSGADSQTMDALAKSAIHAKRLDGRGQFLPDTENGELFRERLSALPDTAVTRRDLSLFELFHFLTTTGLLEMD